MKRLSLTLLLIIFLPSLLAFSPAQQNQELVMTVEAGVAGWYRSGQWIPLQVNIQSQNTDLVGSLQVRVGGLSNTAAQFETTYESPFSISRGGTKRVFLYVSLEDYTQQVQVELVNNEGRVVLNERANIRQLRYEDLLYVVVTESTTGSLDVSRLAIGRGTSYQTSWRLDDLPPSSEALRAIDVMVFSDVNTGDMSPEQQKALQEWVLGGGHLIVTGGNNWQRTTAGLLDLLPTSPRETMTLDNVSDIADFANRSDEDLEAAGLVSASDPLPGAQVLLDIQEVPIITRHWLGNGTVDFVAIDGTTEPFRSWSELPALWYELTVSNRPRPSWSYGVERFPLARDAVSNVTGFDLPSLLQLAAFLALYIFLMGPANYLLLRGIGRRELAWFTIPVLIGVFTAFAYFTGFSLRGDDVTVNQISLIQVWEGQEMARVDGVIGVLSPRRTTYDVLMRDELTLRPLPNINEPNSLSELSIRQTQNYAALNIPVDAAIMTTFATSGYIPAPNFDGGVTITLRGARASARLEGEVTNGLPHTLEGAIILVDDVSYELGDLGAGQTRRFEFLLPMAQAQRMTLGSRVEPSRPIVAAGYYGGYGYYGTDSIDPCQLPIGSLGAFSTTYENVMSALEENCDGGSDSARQLRRRALLVAATNNEIDRSGGRASRVYLMGWSEEPPIDVDIPDTGRVDDGTALYVYEIPSRIENSSEQANLPPGMMRWTIIERDTPGRLADVYGDLSFQLNGQQGLALRFSPDPQAPLRRVERIELDVLWDYTVIGQTRVALWNWEAGEWQDLEISSSNQTRFTSEDRAFVGANNTVQVLIESTDPSAYQQIQGLSLVLRGEE